VAAAELAAPDIDRLFFPPCGASTRCRVIACPYSASWLHYWTHHTWQDSSEQQMISTQNPLSDNTQ